MMRKSKQTESKQNLIDIETGSVTSISELSLIEAPSNIILTHAEREFLLYVQRGDIASLKGLLENYKNKPEELDCNCLDPLGRSAVIVAVENENLDLLEILLQYGIKPKDALLHAINEEYVEGVEMLLQWEEKKHVRGQAYSWENMFRDTATFTKDVTPLILAAHRNHYEILKLLLDRGASLPMPHDIKCGCDDCIFSTEEDSLRHSLSRINAYRALSSPSLISLSSKDPILTSFELSAELTRLEGLEHEFKVDYIALNKRVRKFATELLDQIRTKSELSTVLNYNPEGEPWIEGEAHSLDRLKQAIKYSQKSFVSHPNVQQLLGAIWYDGLPGFKRKTAFSKCLEMAKIACMLPILSLAYIINPHSEKGKFLKKPFVKFICHCSSYLFFLMLLALASQRIEYLLIEWFGNSWMKEILQDWKTRERGSLPGMVEMLIVIYVTALIWSEVKQLWGSGLLGYINDLWNIVDYITNMFFTAWILLRATSWILVQRDLRWRSQWPWYPREEWHAYDPMLISEGCFGAAMIFSYLKLVNIFSVNPHLGPLQISLGRMIFDILKFFCLYTLVLFAFGCGLNQLMWYYAELEMNKCYHLPGGLPDYDNEEKSCFIWRRFANLFETSQSLFWASFGLIDLGIFELTGVGSFTRFWALLMFGSYSVINVIVLLNLLIAMMSNSYQLISERADAEWKFARTKLWLSYFEDGSTVPPPFNIVPTPKAIFQLCCQSEPKLDPGSIKRKSRKAADLNHQNVMRLMVRRFVTEQQRRADEKGVTEDDINEVKQFISTFRYELIDILKNNGMNTSMATAEDPTVIGKRGRALERKLMKGFNIGIVEGIVNDILKETSKPTNIFGKLANAIGRKSKTDWNAKMSRVSVKVKDQIGSSEKSLKRSHASIRRRMKFENESLLKSMNPKSILEYNPNLERYSPATQVAYAKFKVNTLKKEKERIEKEKKMNEKKGVEAEIFDEKTSGDTGHSASQSSLFANPEEVAENDMTAIFLAEVTRSNVEKLDPIVEPSDADVELSVAVGEECGVDVQKLGFILTAPIEDVRLLENSIELSDTDVQEKIDIAKEAIRLIEDLETKNFQSVHESKHAHEFLDKRLNKNVVDRVRCSDIDKALCKLTNIKDEQDVITSIMDGKGVRIGSLYKEHLPPLKLIIDSNSLVTKKTVEDIPGSIPAPRASGENDSQMCNAKAKIMKLQPYSERDMVMNSQLGSGRGKVMNHQPASEKDKVMSSQPCSEMFKIHNQSPSRRTQVVDLQPYSERVKLRNTQPRSNGDEVQHKIITSSAVSSHSGASTKSFEIVTKASKNIDTTLKDKKPMERKNEKVEADKIIKDQVQTFQTPDSLNNLPESTKENRQKNINKDRYTITLEDENKALYDNCKIPSYELKVESIAEQTSKPDFLLSTEEFKKAGLFNKLNSPLENEDVRKEVIQEEGKINFECKIENVKEIEIRELDYINQIKNQIILAGDTKPITEKLTVDGSTYSKDKKSTDPVEDMKNENQSSESGEEKDFLKKEDKNDIPYKEGEKGIPRKEGEKDILFNDDNKDIPFKEKNKDSPCKEIKKDMPCKEIKKDMPCKEIKKDIPCKEGNKDISIPEESKHKLNVTSMETKERRLEERPPTPSGKSILSGQVRTGWL